MTYIEAHEAGVRLLQMLCGRLQLSAQRRLHAEGELIDTLLTAVESIVQTGQRRGRGEPRELLAGLDERIASCAVHPQGELFDLLFDPVLGGSDQLGSGGWGWSAEVGDEIR